MSSIAIVGGGPSGLVFAIALARRGVRSTVFERAEHPEVAPRFNPDRSYTIDISGHGLKAIRHIDAVAAFDERMIPFKGLKLPNGTVQPWDLPGWTGSRGDILRALMAAAAPHGDTIDLRFDTKVDAVDVDAGTVNGEYFDFVVGSDGTGSVVRDALQARAPGFTVSKGSHPNWCTMIELDRVGDALDRNYLHGLSTRPFCAAGAIKGDQGGDSSRWFCAVGTKEKKEFPSIDAARAYLSARVPRILELTSDEKIAAYAKRPCYHIGQTLSCSQLHGGKAVLLGDAAAAFPPIGQGVNAAMESAMTLDLCIGETDDSTAGLLEAAQRYTTRWKPEADAVAWMAVKSLFENRLHFLRAAIAGRLGISIFAQAKSVDVPYSEVRRKAELLGPFWA